MDSAQAVSLSPATPSDQILLGNLLELYIHDLSAVFPNVQLGPDGRFGYPRAVVVLERRAAPPSVHHSVGRPDRRIHSGAAPVRHPAATHPSTMSPSSSYSGPDRRSGVGRQAARLLWNQLAGQWTVRVAEANRPALAFWSSRDRRVYGWHGIRLAPSFAKVRTWQCSSHSPRQGRHRRTPRQNRDQPLPGVVHAHAVLHGESRSPSHPGPRRCSRTPRVPECSSVQSASVESMSGERLRQVAAAGLVIGARNPSLRRRKIVVGKPSTVALTRAYESPTIVVSESARRSLAPRAASNSRSGVNANNSGARRRRRCSAEPTATPRRRDGSRHPCRRRRSPPA